MSAPPARKRVIKKVAGHGHHGGAWKIAYADFVTAMMALFMVLWLLASTDQKSREEISNYFRTGVLPDAELAMNGGATYVPSIIEKSPAPPPPDQQTLDDTVKSLKDAIAHMAENHVDLAEMAGKIKVVATPDGVLIEANDDDAGMLFDSSSSRLKPGLEEFLRELTPMLTKRTEPLEIQGHTDATQFTRGAGKTNWELSFERATEARKILERNGLDPGRVGAVIGRGSTQLAVPDEPYSPKNRRLTVLLRMTPVATVRQPVPQPARQP
jgi:chemotaxis protein MotB